MIGFDAIGTHAIAEVTSPLSEPITYGPFSRVPGLFTSVWFRRSPRRADPVSGSQDIEWDTGAVIEWDDNTTIEWD